MSEYNHGDFPCDMPANTPEFNEGYVVIQWDTPHDESGNLLRGDAKAEAEAERQQGRKL